MSLDQINLGSAPNDGTGDDLRSAGEKINAAIDAVNTLAAVATSGAYNDLSGKPSLGTAAALNVGTSADEIVRLDGSAKLPAIDGSQLTNLAGAAGSNGFADPTIKFTGSFDHAMQFFDNVTIDRVDYQNDATLTSLEFSNVGRITNTFGLNILSALTSLSFPVLLTMDGDFAVTECPALTNVSLPYLGTAHYFTLSNQGGDMPIATLNLSSLQHVAVDFTLYGLGGSLDTISLDALQFCGGHLSVHNMANLVSFALPAIVHIGDFLTLDVNPSLTSVTLGSGLFVLAGNVNANGAALSEASVDGILASLVALDGTGGTSIYQNRTVYLDGGTSSPPSGAGLANKAILEGRGCTVHVNS